MKTNIYVLSTIIFCALAFAFVPSCVGPAGEDGIAGADGTDGIDGTDGNATCMDCHSSGNIQSINEQFTQSVHSAGEVALAYAGGNASWGCAQCHSSEGFIEFANNGFVDQNIKAPSPWECKTCHSLHTTFEADDYALRLSDPIDFIYDNTVAADFGNGNLCSNCHQSRTAEPNITNPGTDFAITSTHYGPHHGAQSNVLYGVGFAEIAGSMTYPTAGSSTHYTSEEASCTGCHMSTYGDGEGGHTWNPGLTACTTCHAGATDFDINETQTAIALQLDELRDLLIDQGVIELGEEELYELNPETGLIELVLHTEGYHPVVATHSMEQAQAFFNWVGLSEDRSLGAHNQEYVEALLTNSIEAISP